MRPAFEIDETSWPELRVSLMDSGDISITQGNASGDDDDQVCVDLSQAGELLRALELVIKAAEGG